jgi:uncharacterized protein involved in exopolysaccharide biosynthesis
VPSRDVDAYALAREVLQKAYQRWSLSLSIFALVFGLVAVFTALQTPTYEASSLLLVKSLGREFMSRAHVGDETFVPRNREAVIHSELQILRLRDVIGGVISAMGLERLYPDLAKSSEPEDRRLEKATASFGGDLFAEVLGKTDVIRVAFQHEDPAVAAEALNLLVDRFKGKHLEAFSEPEAAVFLEGKAVEYLTALTSAEERLKSFQSEHEAFALKDPDAYLLRQRTDLNQNLRTIQGDIAAARRQHAQEDPAIQRAKTELLDLQLKEQDLRAGYRGTRRELEDTREKIALVKAFIDSRTREGAQRHQEELELLENQKLQIEDRLAHVQSELKGLSRLTAEYRTLSRDVEVKEQNYRAFVGRAEEARVSAEMDVEKIANISVIEKAVPPMDPVRPRKVLNLAAGVSVGAALALLLPFLIPPLPWPNF